MLPTASELEAVLISCRESGEGQKCVGRRVLDGPALNEEEIGIPTGAGCIRRSTSKRELGATGCAVLYWPPAVPGRRAF